MSFTIFRQWNSCNLHISMSILEQCHPFNSNDNDRDMNHDQRISIPQGPITRTRAKKLQQTLYTCIQAMVSSSKKILEDVGDLPYMLCKVELQERDALNATNASLS